MGLKAQSLEEFKLQILQDDLKSVKHNISILWDMNNNLTKAQDHFILKLLEIDNVSNFCIFCPKTVILTHFFAI